MFVGLYDELVKWRHGFPYWKLRFKILAVIVIAFLILLVIWGGHQIILNFNAGADSSTSKNSPPRQTAQGTEAKQLMTTGDGSPITYNDNRTFILKYDDVIAKEITKAEPTILVDDGTIEEFFKKLQIALAKERQKIPKEKLKKLPSFLQTSYDINVTISSTHGVGYEFITPSKNPETNISRTKMPIEKYYFSKYTDNLDYSNAEVPPLLRFQKYSGLFDINLIGGKELIAVLDDGDVTLAGIGIKYSFNDSIKNIDFLKLFGSNKKEYWTLRSAEDEAFALYKSFETYHQF